MLIDEQYSNIVSLLCKVVEGLLNGRIFCFGIYHKKVFLGVWRLGDMLFAHSQYILTETMRLELDIHQYQQAAGLSQSPRSQCKQPIHARKIDTYLITYNSKKMAILICRWWSCHHKRRLY